jgi:N-formylglutamate amidohydrolase
MPIIISAPHAQSTIRDKKLRKRIRLTDYEVWKCSDPYTDRLKEFTCAKYIQKGRTHRLICDLNRPPDDRAFHHKDFFKRTVFKKGEFFSVHEQKELIEKYWIPYHFKLEKKIKKVDQKSSKPLLIVEYHNTSGDHPLNTRHEYMPAIVISNLGEKATGRKTKNSPHISMPVKYIKFLEKSIKENLKITTEINDVYHGGYNTLWLSQIKTKNRLYVVQVEYNLDFIHNPISQKVDLKALKIMQKGLNKSLQSLYKFITAKRLP